MKPKPRLTASRVALFAGLALISIGTLEAQDTTVQLLEKVSNAPGPPGFEEPIRKILVEYMKPLASSIRYDGMGSIIAAHGSAGPRVMVDAHMDEARRDDPPDHAQRIPDHADAGRVAGSGVGGSTLGDHRSKWSGTRRHRDPGCPRGSRRGAHARLFARQFVSRCRRQKRGRGSRDGDFTGRSCGAGFAVHGAQRDRKLSRQGLGRSGRLRGDRGGNAPPEPSRIQTRSFGPLPPRKRSACEARIRLSTS